MPSQPPPVEEQNAEVCDKNAATATSSNLVNEDHCLSTGEASTDACGLLQLKKQQGRPPTLFSSAVGCEQPGFEQQVPTSP